MWNSIMAVSAGAALGALLRWELGARLNQLFPTIPPGTLAANVGGGYLIGVAIAFFAQHPSLAPEWRLLIITGFLGGLTLSAVKRSLGAKDWGTMIKGHGGMMDRMDSVVFAAPIFFHLTRFFFTLPLPDSASLHLFFGVN